MAKCKKVKIICQGCVVPGIALGVWCIMSLGHTSAYAFYPSPQQLFAAFAHVLKNGSLVLHIFTSLLRVLCGVFFSTLCAACLVFFLFLYPVGRPYLLPSLRFVRHIPPLALLSLFILWFGIGEKPKIILVALASFFPIFLNFFKGLELCDYKLIEVGQVAQFSRKQLFIKIILPALLPFIITGLQLGLSYGWRSLVGAELIAATSGLGYFITEARALTRCDLVMVGVLTLGLVGTITDAVFARFAQKFTLQLPKDF